MSQIIMYIFSKYWQIFNNTWHFGVSSTQLLNINVLLISAREWLSRRFVSSFRSHYQSNMMIGLLSLFLRKLCPTRALSQNTNWRRGARVRVSPTSLSYIFTNSNEAQIPEVSHNISFFSFVDLVFINPRVFSFSSLLFFLNKKKTLYNESYRSPNSA